MATLEQQQEATREELRGLAMRFAAAIRSDPQAWRPTAEWLLKLPLCQAVLQTRDLTSLPAGQEYWEVPDSPTGHPYYMYDDEQRTSRLWGPVCRRMFNAWDAAVHRFWARRTNVYYDFTLTDARRLAILGSLTFNADFDGKEVGFVWSWSPPQSSEFSFEGRAWVWAKVSCGLFAEHSLVERLRKADECLRANGADGSRPQAGVGARESALVDTIGSLVEGKVEPLARDVTQALSLLQGVLDTGKPSEIAGSKRPKAKVKKKMGPPVVHDAKADDRVRGAWLTGVYRTHEELGRAIGMSAEDVERTLDRVRKR